MEKHDRQGFPKNRKKKEKKKKGKQQNALHGQSVQIIYERRLNKQRTKE